MEYLTAIEVFEKQNSYKVMLENSPIIQEKFDEYYNKIIHFINDNYTERKLLIYERDLITNYDYTREDVSILLNVVKSKFIELGFAFVFYNTVYTLGTEPSLTIDIRWNNNEQPSEIPVKR